MLYISRRILSLTLLNSRYFVRLKSGQTDNELMDLANLQVPKQYKGRKDALADSTSDIGQQSSTAMTMLSQEEGDGMYILKYSTEGFRLKRGIRIVGPTAFFPRHIFHWNVNSSEDITEDSLSLFTMLAPKLDILLLGVGMYGQKVSPQVIQYLRMKKINFEILPTDQACATFNFLNSDRRWVAAAMIPPTTMPVFHPELQSPSYTDFTQVDSTAGFTDLGHSDIAGPMERMKGYWKGEGTMGEDAKILIEDYQKFKENKQMFKKIKKRGIERRRQERLLQQKNDTDEPTDK